MTDDQPDAQKVLEALRRIDHFLVRASDVSGSATAQVDLELVRGFVVFRAVSLGAQASTLEALAAVLHDSHEVARGCAHTPTSSTCEDEARWVMRNSR